MRANEYQRQAMFFNDGKSAERLKGVVDRFSEHGWNYAEADHAVKGLVGESGELADLIKKITYHEKPIDEVHLKKELGDICWYVAMMCCAMNWDIEDVMALNIEKLSERYPEGFDTERANNRKEGDI